MKKTSILNQLNAHSQLAYSSIKQSSNYILLQKVELATYYIESDEILDYVL
ncbi:hypothetical protein [Radiobacillus sp. PE A8.2]|uniref:hypothetical protein n=1 Tax=Radiobacillus sp. PE A8.2 TaxID=3380349 RepID=UPI00388D622F